MTLNIILRTFVKPVRPFAFAQLSFDADDRAVLAPLRRLIVGRSIFGRLHAAQRDGDSICCPFYTTTSFAAVKSAQAKTSTTVSVGRNGVELCLTFLYHRRRHGLKESDTFESQQLIRRRSRESGASIIQRGIKGI